MVIHRMRGEIKAEIMKYFWILVFLPIFLWGCMADDRLLPRGKYISDENQEYVIVSGAEVKFHLFDIEQQVFLKKRYKHSIYSDGRIQFYPNTSVEAVYGIGRYDWFWKGDKIERIDPKTKIIMVFRKSTD